MNFAESKQDKLQIVLSRYNQPVCRSKRRQIFIVRIDKYKYFQLAMRNWRCPREWRVVAPKTYILQTGCLLDVSQAFSENRRTPGERRTFKRIPLARDDQGCAGARLFSDKTARFVETRSRQRGLLWTMCTDTSTEQNVSLPAMKKSDRVALTQTLR